MNDELLTSIKINEGFKDHVYSDILGNATVGYGFLVGALTKDELALNNGQVEPMPKERAEAILMLKLNKLYKSVFDEWEWLAKKPAKVQNVIIEMCYQMGIAKVKKFKTTLALIKESKYVQAYSQGMRSAWASQTPNRAKKVLAPLKEV